MSKDVYSSFFLYQIFDTNFSVSAAMTDDARCSCYGENDTKHDHLKLTECLSLWKLGGRHKLIYI